MESASVDALGRDEFEVAVAGVRVASGVEPRLRDRREVFALAKLGEVGRVGAARLLSARR